MADTEASRPPAREGMIRCEDGSIEVFDQYPSDDEIFHDGRHEMSDDEWEDYCRQVRESDGFDVRSVPGVADLGLITPMNLELCKEDFVCDAKLGIAHYNEAENASLELVDIINVTARPRILFITFEARETLTGQIGTYQTKVCETTYVEFTRVKPEKGLSETKGREREEEEKEKEKEKEKESDAKRLKSEMNSQA